MAGTDLKKILANRIKTIRKTKQLRQEDMENKGINYKYYQRIESGNANVTIKTLEKLADALEVSVVDFFPLSRSADIEREVEIEEGIVLLRSIIEKNDRETIRKLKVFLEQILRISVQKKR